MSSLSSSDPELSRLINNVVNELVPEFNVKVQNAILFMNIYLCLVVFTALLSFINIILSVRTMRKIKNVDSSNV